MKQTQKHTQTCPFIFIFVHKAKELGRQRVSQMEVGGRVGGGGVVGRGRDGVEGGGAGGGGRGGRQ